MAFITPAKIAEKAARIYPKFLEAWIAGQEEEFFPCRIPAAMSLDKRDVAGTIRAMELLNRHSKEVKGWGYEIERKLKRSQVFGANRVPSALFVPTRDDLLRLARRKAQFDQTCRVVDRLRSAMPELDPWLASHVSALHKYAEPLEGLIAVTQFFVAHPWPDCYARQIPVKVDTKFIERHSGVLREWLDRLLPRSAIAPHEKKFARRFGLRDGQPHRAIRLLDPDLAAELGLPFDELSLPMRSIAPLPVKNATVVVVENNLNLLTLPPMKRGLAIRGAGSNVSRLHQIEWLHTNRLLYWGDIDVAGLDILSRLRQLFPHVESVLMDLPALLENRASCGKNKGKIGSPPANLTPGEREAYEYCLAHDVGLEQEQIPQAQVDALLGPY